ncbi:MAG: toll/interleukin-1 receptor domain-containing protein [Xanthobacteraceae bacterium]|jgi:hypothetical protein
MMVFDAFLSYPHADKATADAVCATLESEGIRCWIAPRDITPGEEWAAAIFHAINHCRVMILIFSSRANESRQVRREVECAISNGVPVVPLRIEDVVPTASLAYFMASVHWLDALTPPLEKHLQRLADSVKELLQINQVNTEKFDGAGASSSDGLKVIPVKQAKAFELCWLIFILMMEDAAHPRAIISQIKVYLDEFSIKLAKGEFENYIKLKDKGDAIMNLAEEIGGALIAKSPSQAHYFQGCFNMFLCLRDNKRETFQKIAKELNVRDRMAPNTENIKDQFNLIHKYIRDQIN